MLKPVSLYSKDKEPPTAPLEEPKQAFFPKSLRSSSSSSSIQFPIQVDYEGQGPGGGGTHRASLPSSGSVSISDIAIKEDTSSMGYTKTIDSFLEGWFCRIQAYKEGYSQDALAKETINLVMTIITVVMSMYTASGNIYVISNAWSSLTYFQISVDIASLILAIICTVVRILNFQENSIRGLHAATSLSSIAHDIILNQSLRPQKRMYAGIFIQNIVKRTEAVLNLAYPINIREKDLHGQHFAKVRNGMKHRGESQTFNSLLDEVHRQTGICPKEMFSKAHIATHVSRENVYVTPPKHPPMSPPFHMKRQVDNDMETMSNTTMFC